MGNNTLKDTNQLAALSPRRGRTQLICDKRQRGIAAGNPQGEVWVKKRFGYFSAFEK